MRERRETETREWGRVSKGSREGRAGISCMLSGQEDAESAWAGMRNPRSSPFPAAQASLEGQSGSFLISPAGLGSSCLRRIRRSRPVRLSWELGKVLEQIPWGVLTGHEQDKQESHTGFVTGPA